MKIQTLHPDKSEIKFETYRYYLESFLNFLQNEYIDFENFVDICAKHSCRLQGIKSFDNNLIEPRFKIAWSTEFLLNSNIENINLIRANNLWSPVQAYYAIYSAAEAIAYVLDGTPSNSHKSTLRKISSHFVKSGLSPWNFAYSGHRGKNGSSHQPINFPPDLQVPHHLQRSGIEPIQMIAKCLKAEHSHRIDDLWNSGTQKHKYEYDPGKTSLLHFIYRLRIKSNYQEVDLFIVNAPDYQIRGFANSLKMLCTWSVAYFEIMLARKCGKKYLLQLIDGYLDLNSDHQILKNRADLYNNVL